MMIILLSALNEGQCKIPRMKTGNHTSIDTDGLNGDRFYLKIGCALLKFNRRALKILEVDYFPF